MSADETKRVIFVPSNPMAYAFEPVMRRRVERPIFAGDEGDAVGPGGNGSEERVGNTSWCTGSHCSTMLTTMESVCYHDANLDSVLGELSCITLSYTFQKFCCERPYYPRVKSAQTDVTNVSMQCPISLFCCH